MKKKLITRTLLGFPLGIFISTTITICISLGVASGSYSAVVPQLTQQIGSEIGAVLVQYFLSGLLGAACAGGSLVWEMQNWSLLRQTVTHYCILTFSMFPIAWLAWWMPHTVPGALLYFGLFMAVYIIMFVVILTYWKRRIQKMDACLQNNRTDPQ